MARILLLAALWAAGGCTHRLMPTPNLYLDRSDDPFESVPELLRSPTMELLYATDRQPLLENYEFVGYGSARSHSLAYGTVLVELGEDLSWESLREASLSRHRHEDIIPRVTAIDELARLPDATHRFTMEKDQLVPREEILEVEAAVQRQMLELLRQRLAMTDQKELFLYVHGYNKSFNDAANTLAQIWHFLGRIGVPMIYSWPAGYGGLRGYAVDRESGEFTIFHLKQCLRLLVACPELEKIHILAHSRGADVILTALRELHIEISSQGRDTQAVLKLDNLVLAAPDLDLEVGMQRIGAEGVLNIPNRSTVYFSAKDKAIRFSSLVFSSIRRLGILKPSDLSDEQKRDIAMLPQLQLIDARIRLTDFTGHGYFYKNPAVSSDLILILRNDLDPGIQNGRPLEAVSANFWRLDDKYPRWPD